MNQLHLFNIFNNDCNAQFWIKIVDFGLICVTNTMVEIKIGVFFRINQSDPHFSREISFDGENLIIELRHFVL